MHNEDCDNLLDVITKEEEEEIYYPKLQLLQLIITFIFIIF